MKLIGRSLLIFQVLFCLLACEQTQQETPLAKNNTNVNSRLTVPNKDPSEQYPGGKTTIKLMTKMSFLTPIANIHKDLRTDFYAGQALAKQPWIKAPTTTTARDGLGPIYNARTCLACHKRGGRGKAPRNTSEVLLSTIVRLSIPGSDKIHGVKAEPNYGDQVQTQSIALAHQLRTQIKQDQLQHTEVAAEAYAYLNWEESTFIYPDGQKVQLSKPSLNLKKLAYGKLHPETKISLRVAPPLLGLGLLEAIAQEDIDILADPQDKDNDGISGRVNHVWDFEKKKAAPGRFGLKGNKPNLYNLTAAAFVNDIGITNPLFPNQPCTKIQTLCHAAENGNDVVVSLDSNLNHPISVELPRSLLKLTSDFVSQLGVPAKRSKNKYSIIKGRNYFYQVGCQSCHQPKFKTGHSEIEALAGQVIWPYSDLLLHDMGGGLADGRNDYLANGNEWRTPPLWGVGLASEVNGNQNYLHDGRAQTIEEAILWHGGEAAMTHYRFTQLTKKSREQLFAFVSSL